ncbi:pyridoxamine 5'-phosphate oxidase [Gammaproteobacteria bacterium]|nr:pyridoxamine 5'-phosphate oxidase [Gammaproteobacteria bacterium]
MIEFNNLCTSEPYLLFADCYKKALESNQKIIEAISISSFDKIQNEVDSRFVNLKYINKDEWIFFSNYNSPKANQFKSHDQITAVFYWSSINVQIRMKAFIKKTDKDFSDKHFKGRNHSKNALAISSNQSEPIQSYKKVIQIYEKIKSQDSNLYSRPDYWGGFSFTPYCIEFWEGHNSRLNKRTLFTLEKSKWIKVFLQP